VRSHPNIF